MLGLKLIVSGTTKSTLIAVKLGQLTTNGQGQYNCYVEVPDEWQGKSVHAVFNTTSQLVVDKYVDIPDNELQKELIQISIIGKDDLETYTTNIVNVKVVQGYNCNDILVMTPSEWEQYITIIDAKVDSASDSASNAETSETNAKTSELNAKASEDRAEEILGNIEDKTADYNINAQEKLDDFNTNYTEKLESFNDNATNKTSDFDSNAENKTKIFDDNVTSKTDDYKDLSEEKEKDLTDLSTTLTTSFNDNASSKTSDFDNHVVEKIDEFDDNVSDKTDDFNNNYTAKVTAFDNNASTKTSNFNTNVSDKTASFETLVDTSVTTINEKIAVTTDQVTEIEGYYQDIINGDVNGATFIPSQELITSDSVKFSWTNDKGFTNPNSVVITAPTGVKGDTGVSISTIAKTSTDGLVDTYTITFSDNTTTSFTVTNGVSISSVIKTSTTDLVDTYTITFSNSTTSTFEVTNGFTPTISVKTNTDDEYVLTITGQDGNYDTPNLKSDDVNIDTAIIDYVGDRTALYDETEQNEATVVDFVKSNKSELEKARESFLGDLYEDLYARLMADFSAVYDRFNQASLVPYSDTFINASNTYVGLTSGTEIKGVTVQDQYYIQTVEDSVVQFDDAVGEYAVVTSNVDCTLTRCGKNLLNIQDVIRFTSGASYGQTTENSISFDYDGTYPRVEINATQFNATIGKTLSFQYENLINTNSTANDAIQFYGTVESGSSHCSIKSKNGMSFTIENNTGYPLTDMQMLGFYGNNSATSQSGSYSIENPMIVLGETLGDYETYTGETYTLTANTPTQIPLLDGTNTFCADSVDNLTVRYLTETETEETTPTVDFPQEMSSVEGDLVVKSVGKNLQKSSVLLTNQSTGWCDAYGFRDSNGNSKTETSIYLKSGTVINIKIEDSVNLGVTQLRQALVEGQPQQIATLSLVNVNSITIANDGYYTIKSYINNAADTFFGNIMMNIGSALPYEPYTEDTTTYSDITLRSLPNGVCDVVKPITGTITKNIGIRDYADGDYELSNVYTDGTNTLYQLDTPITEELSEDKKELRTYDGTTNIFTTGTDVMPVISTKVPSDVTAIVSSQSSQIATQANTINQQADMINEQSSHIAYLESNLNNVQNQSNDTDDVLNELIGGDVI